MLCLSKGPWSGRASWLVSSGLLAAPPPSCAPALRVTGLIVEDRDGSPVLLAFLSGCSLRWTAAPPPAPVPPAATLHPLPRPRPPDPCGISCEHTEIKWGLVHGPPCLSFPPELYDAAGEPSWSEWFLAGGQMSLRMTAFFFTRNKGKDCLAKSTKLLILLFIWPGNSSLTCDGCWLCQTHFSLPSRQFIVESVQYIQGQVEELTISRRGGRRRLGQKGPWESQTPAFLQIYRPQHFYGVR